MKTLRLTAGEAVIKYLDNQYVSLDGKESKFVEKAFTLFGHGCVLGTGEALAMAKHGIKVYQGKNEQGMAHVAMSYAKQHNRRKIIPCFSSIGPGAANMVTAAATATVNNIPLLLFPGDTFATRQPDPVLQQVEQPHDLTITTNDAYKAVVRYFDRVYRPEMVMTALTNAMRVLTDTSSCGAVCIAFPQDVQAETYEYPAEFFEKRVHKIARLHPDEGEIISAAEAIKASKKPLIIVGGGARYSEAGEVISVFSEKYNIPIAETQSGKSAIKGSHPLNLGGVGVTGNSAANTIAAEADLVIGIGTRFSDFTTASKALYPNAKVISVNTSAYHADKLSALRVLGDAKVTVVALDKALEGYKSSYEGEIKAAKENWAKEYDRLAKVEFGKGYQGEVESKTPFTMEDFSKLTGSALCQTAAIAKIREVIGKNAIVVGASGSLPGCLQRMWETDSKYGYNMEYGYSCMGYEIAGALGSKLAEPGREVYAMAGDGSYLMLHSELVTAVQEGVKINVLLFDNGGFGCINNLQMGSGIDSACTEFRFRNGDESVPTGSFMHIDYAMSAKGYGCKTYTAKSLEELEEALIDSKKQTVSTLIDIKVLPKTMTSGYGGWWNTGCSTLPRNDRQEKTLKEKEDALKKARKY